MDLDCNKAMCGTCNDWDGKRIWASAGIIRLSASAKGKCGRLNKLKPPQGGCDHWQKSEEGAKDEQDGTDSRG